MKRIQLLLLTALLSLSMLLTACTGNQAPNGTDTDGTGESGGPKQPNFEDKTITVDPVTPVSADLSVYDFTYSARDEEGTVNETGASKIVFSRTSISISGKGATASGTNLTINTAGTYILSGSATAGSIKVAAADTDKVQLVLDGLTLTNPDGPALFISSADKVFLTLAEGSQNKLTDGELYIKTDNGTPLDAAIFSRADLTVNGSGSLQVNGKFKHGIVSKDDFVMTGGVLTVDALYQGISGKDCVKIGGGELTVNAGTDGIQSDNDTDVGRGFVSITGGKLKITAANDAIQAETVLRIVGGEGTLLSGGGSQKQPSEIDSSKGLKAKSDVVITGGSFVLDCADDAINAGGSVLLSGGALTVSTANDAIHADLSLAVSDGTVTIQHSREGLEAQDVLISGGQVTVTASDDGIKAAHEIEGAAAMLISGGVLVVDAEGDGIDVDGRLAVTGGVTLIQASSDPEQRSFEYETVAVITGGTFVALSNGNKVKNFTDAVNQCAVQAGFSAQNAGTPLTICDAQGKVLLSLTGTKAFRTAVISAPTLDGSTTYTLLGGGTVSGADANGYAADTTVTGGKTLATFTLKKRLQTVAGN